MTFTMRLLTELVIKMKRYRITKYNPQYRVDGKYLINEWTDYSDIGKVYDGKVLTREEYCSVESNYIYCATTLLKMASVKGLIIVWLECLHGRKWQPNLYVNLKLVANLIRLTLRNKIWCKLESKNSYLHFGYDYYMFIGVDLPFEAVKKVCAEYNLFCEEFDSPYLGDEDRQ